MWSKDIWTTTPVEEEDLIENVDGMWVCCLFEGISYIGLTGFKGRRTVWASSTIISHIRSEWKANSSESSNMSHACSSCKGLCRYCSVEYNQLTCACIESLTRAVVCCTQHHKPSESSIEQWKCRCLVFWKIQDVLKLYKTASLESGPSIGGVK